MVTTEQYTRILSRLTQLENQVNDLMVAINKFVTRSEVSQLHTLLETDVDDLNTRVSTLETRVSSIEQESGL